jgi:erythromycin esterase-like protein
MNRFIPALAAACFSLAAATSFAQTTTPPSGERTRPTPEQREAMHKNYKAAREACKGDANRDACMADKMCATAPDKGKCQAHFKDRQAKMGQHMDKHQAMAEACTGKRGDALKQCYHDQHDKMGGMKK